jgi:hypothetical protein
MKQCWPDGDLRAFLDGELPQLGEHLDVCAACSARYRELAERAGRVTNLLAMLPETGVLRNLPAREHYRRRWAVAALSLAAAIAIGFVVLPKRHSTPASVGKAPAAVAHETATAPVAKAETPRRVARRAAARPRPPHENFLRLDDEPLETGTIVRVSAENGDVQADLIVGPDGRAHAIRMVSNQ